MKRIFCNTAAAAALSLALAAPAAAGGLYLYEIGGPEVGLASAGYAARAQDATTVFTNPAGMTKLARPELQVGLQPMYLNIRFDPDSKTTVGGDDGCSSGWLSSGGLFYVQPIGERLRFGFGATSYFGLSLDYTDDWVGRYYVNQAKLQGVSLLPTLAYKINDWFSVGAGLNAMYGQLSEKFAIKDWAFIESRQGADGQLKIKDNAWGFGGNFGVLFEPTKGTRIGATYLSQTKLKFSASPDISGIENFGKGQQALLRGVEGTDLDLTVRTPQAVMVSAFHQFNDRFALMGNVGWQDWSKFGKVDVDVTLMRGTELSGTTSLDYKDTWHAALGAQYRVAAPLLLSCGVAYDSAMLTSEERTPTMPIGSQWRFGLGGQYSVSQSLTLGAGYEIAWGGDLQMDVKRSDAAGRLSGDFNNVAVHFISLNLDWKF